MKLKKYCLTGLSSVFAIGLLFGCGADEEPENEEPQEEQQQDEEMDQQENDDQMNEENQGNGEGQG
ncbi:hypothetical protein [Pseudalkalibacillus decolorationis]|uniref:hypothetical protein n=1 Tax=Pseudalkalibacillus decolorationis TaxID=163879 RepID=UPI002148EF93|nr:hypothetical protein [Pseudalkalibacillus decolorationis]